MIISRGFRILLLNCRIINLIYTRNKSKKTGCISDVKFEALSNSNYIKLIRMKFKENNKQKDWDIIDTHDSVLIVLYNITRKVLIFVKQFRASVYSCHIPAKLKNKPVDVEKYPRELGMTIELCAGLVDKNKPLVEIAKEEVLEECGYDVPLEKFELILHYFANVGIAGRVSTLYYCEVTDDMKVSPGGGVGREIIEVIEMTPEEVEKMFSAPLPGSTIIGYSWFKQHKYK